MSGQTRGRVPESLERIESLAAPLKGNTDMRSIRPLMEHLLGFSMFANAPDAFKARLLTAEVRFRITHAGNVSGATITGALNRFASAVRIPGYSEAIPEQVLALRLRLFTYLPTVLEPPTAGAPDFQTYSPVGAFFIADILLRQKLTNPKFQVSADEWRREGGLQASVPTSAARPPFRAVLESRVLSPEEAANSRITQRTLSDIGVPGTAPAAALDVFFRDLGF